MICERERETEREGKPTTDNESGLYGGLWGPSAKITPHTKLEEEGDGEEPSKK